MLSVVIPTLNAASQLGTTLAALTNDVGDLPLEAIVVDGGSTDATVALAGAENVNLIRAERGRGRQLDAGARSAKGDWLLFLHADTCLATGWRRDVECFVQEPANEERVAAFRLALDDPSAAARRLERLVAWRCARFGLPYGDQGLLIRRDLYRDVGGFRPLPFLEDVDLIRRLGRRRVVILDAVATTSAERYRRAGYMHQGLRNIVLVGLFFAGVSAEHLARFYR